MWSGVLSYRSTLDRLTYVNVEVRPLPMEFGAKFLERSLYWDGRAWPVMHGLVNTLLKIGVWYGVRDRVQDYE
ncbi:hypothetical protein LIER_38515 [Lithospermum erythrorhizon]|uniref:Uncharacterized protein n=1 Tax=Lithospermum erythrorhizon TaxID=34254 RepID=A0AAV3Q483_LITER